MANFTNIDDMLLKQNNADQETYVEEQGIDEKEHLTAEEFVNKIVKPIIELQEDAKKSVKKIKRGSTVFAPNDEGVIIFADDSASINIEALEDITKYVETGGKVTLHLRIASTNNGSDTGNIVEVTVKRFVNGGWNTVMTTSMPSRPLAYTGYDELDITSVLADGDNTIRVEAKDNETLATGQIVFASIVKASLSLTPMFDWERAITNLDSGIPISYAVFGTGVSKNLNVRIYDNAQNQYRDFTYVIGTNTYPLSQPYTPTVNPNDAATDTVKVMSHGVHTIEAWVSCTVGSTTYQSAHVKNQVMIVADTSSTKSYLMIQQTEGINDGVTGEPYIITENFVQTDKLFAYAVYNPTNPANGTKVSFSIDDYSGENNALTLENMAKNNTKYNVPATIQLEGATVGETSYIYLSAKDESGQNFLSTKNDVNLVVAVSNDYDFSPVNGADLYINPSNRSNSESNPARILNAAKKNAAISSVFTGFSFDANDGWLTDDDGLRVLRVLAGQKVTFAYDPFSDFRTNPSSNVTIDLVFKAKNVTNETDPLIKIANDIAASGKFIGVKMAPLEGCIMTASQTTYGQQNFGWRENTRTHIAINICSAIYADASSSKTIALVRVFVNSSPDREFMFALEEGEWGNRDFQFEIGQEAADIDIYSLRVYRKAVSAQGCLQNYKSSLPTAEAKRAFADANDILDSDGTISYEKARNKYSCIVHHGRPTSLEHPDNTTCWLHIDHMVNGVYDKGTSGDICKATKSLPVKGQGSTAKHYPQDWNQQYDVKKSSLPASDTTTPYITKTADDGSVTRLPAISVDGVLKQDGWVDGNGVYKGVYYQLNLGDAKAEKLVGKVNIASSMQSHKMGAIAAYNDLYRAVMGSSLDSIMASDSKARCTCKEDMFLFFVQENDSDKPQFRGIMTFGSGKMDKKTWGYSSDTYPDFAMFEGSDNDQPVTNFERPWNNDVTYNPGEEYYEYNGKGNIDFDAGATEKDDDGKEYPTGTAVEVMKDFINFGYMHCTDLKPWVNNGGTAASLIAAGDTIDIHCQYWVTVADNQAARGDLYSWSPLNSSWVKAGKNYEARNVFTENPSVTFSADYNAVNAALIQSIITRFKAQGGNYYNVRSKLFHSCFVENLIAGTDNCAKNTYYVADPIKHIICFHADDLDTIFKTDNVGWQTKPYYVDRVHHVDDEGNEAYSGTHNMFFNTFDRAYESEKQTMMNDIFTAMASLGGSVQGFFDKYFFDIQRSIPAVAYIEQARVRYEIAQIKVNNNEITIDTVNPITQQLGSQLESELQYMDRRLAYFMSYAAYGQFGVGGGGNSFGFRGYPKRDGTGARIAFTLKPHQYIYPTAAFGQTLINPHERLSPNDTYEIVLDEACSSDTTCSLFGIDYYKEIGNIGNLSVNPAYEISIGGKRLTKVEAYPASGSGEFRPASIKITASLVNNVKINVADVGQNLDMRGLTRLVNADLQGTSLNRVNLPESQNIKSVKLGSRITSISIDNMPKLEELTLQGYSYLEGITIGENVGSLNSLAMVAGAYGANAPIETLVVRNINWTSVSIGMLTWMTDNIETVGLYGNIGIYESDSLTPAVTFAIKQKLLDKFGNIDDKTSADYKGLYIAYASREVLTLGMNGNFYNDGSEYYQFDLVPNSAYVNGYTKVVWSVTSPTLGSACSIDQSGKLRVTTLGSLVDHVTVSAVMTTYYGGVYSTLTASKEIELYDRKAKLGDYVFADGTFSNTLDSQKTVVGICCFVAPRDGNGDIIETLFNKNDKQQRLMVSLSNVAATAKKGTAFTSWQWGAYLNGAPDDATNELYSTGTDGTKTALTCPDAGLDTSAKFFDIQSVANLTSGGLSTSYVNDSTIRDEVSTEGVANSGFKTFASNTAAGDGFAWSESEGERNARILTAELAALAGSEYKTGDMVNSGYAKTLKIIAHRNSILNAGLQQVALGSLGIPQASVSGGTTELADLVNLMEDLQQSMKDKGETNYVKWSQLYYPAASAAYAYQPTVLRSGEKLADKFKSHNWFLPTQGLLERLYWYYSKGTSGSQNIFKEALSKGQFANFTAAAHWSSAEYNQTYAWAVYFSNGTQYNNNKYNSFVVRAVAAF